MFTKVSSGETQVVSAAVRFIEKLSMAPFTDGPQPWYAGTLDRGGVPLLGGDWSSH